MVLWLRRPDQPVSLTEPGQAPDPESWLSGGSLAPTRRTLEQRRGDQFIHFSI